MVVSGRLHDNDVLRTNKVTKNKQTNKKTKKQTLHISTCVHVSCIGDFANIPNNKHSGIIEFIALKSTKTPLKMVLGSDVMMNGW